MNVVTMRIMIAVTITVTKATTTPPMMASVLAELELVGGSGAASDGRVVVVLQ